MRVAGTRSTADHLCRHRRSAPGGAMPIDHEADERARLPAGWRCDRRRRAARAAALYVLAPGDRAAAHSRAAARLMLCGGAPMDGAAPCLVELRLVDAATASTRPRSDWKAGEFPLSAGDDQRVHPAARSADDGQLSVTEFRRVGLSTGVTLNVALAGARGRAGGHPAPWLSGIASDLAGGRAEAGGRLPPGHAGPARLRRLRPAAGRRRLRDRHADRRYFRAR